MKKILLLSFLGMVLAASAAPKGLSPIISPGKDGHLVYDFDARSNRVPDFSTCGYAGGEQEIPNAPIQVIVAPVSGDETMQIQRELDYVGSLPADSNGLRGAVLLLRGRHQVFGGLHITNSGVVLRGQGADENGTILIAAGNDRRTLIQIFGRRDLTTHSNAGWQIADEYVPVGATSFHLTDASGLKTGDRLQVVRPSTKEWIAQLGMTDFGGGEGDWRLVWKPGSRNLVWSRVVKSVVGNLVTVDAPITTAVEKAFGGGMAVEDSVVRVRNVGVENLRLESAFDASNPKDENHSWCAVTMENAADCWVRQVAFAHFAGSAVALYDSCQQVTVEDCASSNPVSEIGGYRRYTFFTMGQQTLFFRCYAEHGRHDFSAGHGAAGPNAFVQCEASEALGDSGAIESWASGTLFDNVRIDGNGLSLANRGANPAGAGWSAANSVLWNCSAAKIICASPPTAQNWAFGAWAEFEGDGVWRNSNGFMKPESLYLAQLADRFGSSVAARVPFMSRSAKESSNPGADEAVELTAASQKPAPLLKNFIVAAATRNPIPSEIGNAKSASEFSSSQLEAQPVTHEISITNGWLICDGKLLIGDFQDVAWWRGNIRPSEAEDAPPALTRFVPGRSGQGFTDELEAVADEMVTGGKAVLDHHYGLWYDRRRDDHERVRRMTGDVWPPFFEQPFARSGQGAAWDGLSQYDLTKFNPWYWSRLKRFAGLCDERGLVLFNENYFQHNSIEAGAHWVDCPWRTANNINDTAFPEPPPFAGDKRIFMAEQFYDETNPARRPLHEHFIRQNLDNFKTNANVIQFISAEFTGPKHFVDFWLDTIAEWKQENPKSKPLIALAATRDVQDAILADPKRSAIVDAIAFRYWWQTDKGLFAPDGGQNLAPRQFQRQWKGGPPGDLNLAVMTAEYRAKYPGKIILAATEQGADFSRAGWAYLCAGGSLPHLPKTTDARLLAAIPQMKPWLADATNKVWALRAASGDRLVYLESTQGNELDWSGETGSFAVWTVDLKTGTVEVLPDKLAGGGKVMLPLAGRRVLWLMKAK